MNAMTGGCQSLRSKRQPATQPGKKMLTMMTGACRLYVNVITTIKGYGNYFWVDVVAQIDAMSEEVLGFQKQCKRLPKVRLCAQGSSSRAQCSAFRMHMAAEAPSYCINHHAGSLCF